MSGTRGRILAAAGEVFATQGIRAGGIERIAARAGVTKRTLYYHFRSKDELIAACLAAGEDAPPRHGDAAPSAAEWLRARIAELAAAAADPRWRGSAFLQVAVELADLPGHPARRLADMHGRRLEAWLAERLRAEGAATPEETARDAMVVLDGAITRMLVHRDAAYAAAAMSLVARILGAEDGTGHR